MARRPRALLTARRGISRISQGRASGGNPTIGQWRRGWVRTLSRRLKARKLLILRSAGNATAAGNARVGWRRRAGARAAASLPVTVSALDLDRVQVHLGKRDAAAIDGLVGTSCGSSPASKSVTKATYRSSKSRGRARKIKAPFRIKTSPEDRKVLSSEYHPCRSSPALASYGLSADSVSRRAHG